MNNKKAFKIRHSEPLICAIETIIAAKAIQKGLGNTLIAIAQHWNREGRIFPSQERLAQMTGVARRTIVTHIKELVDMRLIRTETRPNVMINGQQVRLSNLYHFNADAIGDLLALAKKTLRAAAKKIAKRFTQKDHLAPDQKDHTISSPKGKQEKIKNTPKEDLSLVFLEKRLKAIQSEIAHKTNLKVQAAYKAAVKKNQIARGEILTDDEKALRAVQAARNAELHAKSAKVNDRVQSLEKTLMSNFRNAAVIKPILGELAKFESLLSPMARLMFKKLCF